MQPSEIYEMMSRLFLHWFDSDAAWYDHRDHSLEYWRYTHQREHARRVNL